MFRATETETPRLIEDLLKRIHRQHHEDEQRRRSRHFKHTLPYLLLCALGIFLMQFHIQIYNVIAGPFHLNQKQLATKLQLYHQNLSSLSLSRWFSLPKEYLQIEIGEGHLQRDRPNALRVFDDEYTRKTILATIHIVKEPTIADGLSPDQFFIRWASETQSHGRVRLPYQFHAFTTRALRCAVRKLGVASTVYRTWLEKPMFVRAVEKHNAANPTHFNTVVAPACGMLIGYLYRPKGELAYRPYSKSAYVFRPDDIALNASHAYYSYKVFAFIGLVLGWLLLKSLVYLMLYLFHWFRPVHLVPSAKVQAQLDKLNVDSLQALDTLLVASSDEQHYHQRLFLIRDRYFLVLETDLNEHDPRTLALFHARSPFNVYSVATITQVVANGFLIGNGHNETWISLPSVTHVMSDNEAQWVHEHMMSLSGTYRQCRMRRRRQMDGMRRKYLLREEENLQQVNFGQTMGQVPLPSPRFIADFRFKTHPKVQADQTELLASTCMICLDNFEIGQSYERWPCPARHPYHCLCMLGVLRVTNMCPLCRRPAEPVRVPDRNALLRLMFRNFFYRVAV